MRKYLLALAILLLFQGTSLGATVEERLAALEADNARLRDLIETTAPPGSWAQRYAFPQDGNPLAPGYPRFQRGTLLQGPFAVEDPTITDPVVRNATAFKLDHQERPGPQRNGMGPYTWGNAKLYAPGAIMIGVIGDTPEIMGYQILVDRDGRPISTLADQEGARVFRIYETLAYSGEAHRRGKGLDFTGRSNEILFRYRRGIEFWSTTDENRAELVMSGRFQESPALNSGRTSLVLGFAKGEGLSRSTIYRNVKLGRPTFTINIPGVGPVTGFLNVEGRPADSIPFVAYIDPIEPGQERP